MFAHVGALHTRVKHPCMGCCCAPVVSTPSSAPAGPAVAHPHRVAAVLQQHLTGCHTRLGLFVCCSGVCARGAGSMRHALGWVCWLSIGTEPGAARHGTALHCTHATWHQHNVDAPEGVPAAQDASNRKWRYYHQHMHTQHSLVFMWFASAHMCMQQSGLLCHKKFSPAHMHMRQAGWCSPVSCACMSGQGWLSVQLSCLESLLFCTSTHAHASNIAMYNGLWKFIAKAGTWRPEVDPSLQHSCLWSLSGSTSTHAHKASKALLLACGVVHARQGQTWPSRSINVVNLMLSCTSKHAHTASMPQTVVCGPRCHGKPERFLDLDAMA